MPDGIFRSGSLDLPEVPVLRDSVSVSWIDSEINCILVVVSVLLAILAFRSFMWVFPAVRQSLFRPRVCLNLEHSLSMAKARNLSALALVLPFCLILDRYSVLKHYLQWDLPSWAGPLAVSALLLLYVLTRRILCACLKPRRMDYDHLSAIRQTIYSLFILLCIALMLSTAVFELLGVSDDAARVVIFVEAGIFYLVSLVRTVQFLSAFCNGLATILYLCALEFVPVAAVVAPCAFLRL